MQQEVSRGLYGSFASVESEERREGGNTFSAMLRPIGFPYGEIRRPVSARRWPWLVWFVAWLAGVEVGAGPGRLGRFGSAQNHQAYHAE